MKNLNILLFFMAFASSFQLLAQGTPLVDQRQQHQRHRIQQGVASGCITERSTPSKNEPSEEQKLTVLLPTPRKPEFIINRIKLADSFEEINTMAKIGPVQTKF